MNDFGKTPYVSRRMFFISMLMLLSVCVLMFASLLLFNAGDGQNEASEYAVINDSAYVAADAYGVMFILRNIDGRVAVLNSLETSILEILDVNVSELDENVRNELEGGLCVSSVSELISVLASAHIN